MAELAFNGSIQPYLDETGDLKTIEGRDAAEQHISLKIQDALYGVLSQYDSDDVAAKINKEVRTIIRNTDYLNSAKRVSVRRISDQRREGSYDVRAQIRGAENIDFIVQNL